MTKPLYHIFKRSNSPNWYVWSIRNGKQYPKSTGLSVNQYTRAQAQELVNEASGIETPSELTIGKLRNYIIYRMAKENRSERTIKQFRISIDWLASIYGEEYSVSLIDRSVIWKMKEYGYNRRVTPHTINTMIAYIHSAFNILVRDNRITGNPFSHFERVKAPGSDRKSLDHKQFSRFLAVLNAWKHEPARRLIRIILFTGLRRTEILYLKRTDIELSNGIPVRFRPVNVKRRDKRQRWLAIPKSAREDIQWFLDRGRGDMPFKVCEKSTITHWAKEMFVAAGLPEFNTKSLRHTFATRALEMGISIRDLQRYLDHSDTRITEIYAHDLDRRELEIDIGE
jgi:integrase